MKSTFIIAALLVSNLAFATSGNNNVKVVADTTSAVYKVSYKGSEVSPVKISILNSNKKVVYSETIKMDAFVRPYNFSNMAEGEYTIVLEDKNGRTEEKISYITSKVASTAKISKIAGEENKYIFRAVSPKNEMVTLKIYDANNVLVYQESIKVKGHTAMVYNLSKIEGAPSFEISNTSGVIANVKF